MNFWCGMGGEFTLDNGQGIKGCSHFLIAIFGNNFFDFYGNHVDI